MNENERIIQQHIAELPASVRKAIEQFNWAQVVLDIAQEHHLSLDKADKFHDQTLLVILNITQAQDYAQNLKEDLDLNDEQAESLVEEANKRIFRELQRYAFKPQAETQHVIRKEGTGVIKEMKLPEGHIAKVPQQNMEKESLEQMIIKKGDHTQISL